MLISVVVAIDSKEPRTPEGLTPFEDGETPMHPGWHHKAFMGTCSVQEFTEILNGVLPARLDDMQDGAIMLVKEDKDLRIELYATPHHDESPPNGYLVRLVQETPSKAA